MTDERLTRISQCVIRGKIDAASPHPPDLQRQEGADELTARALREDVSPQDILSDALIPGMKIVGDRFRDNEIYLPDVLMSARAMTAAMNHIRPYFTSGNVRYRGKLVLGTVAGDLHDIGKKIVGMFFEGGGWRVIDCGVDVTEERFLAAIREHEPDAVGLSALLTTTMVNMESIVKGIRNAFPSVRIIIGGAPVTQSFADRIGADFYSPDPQAALDRLSSAVT